MSKRNGINIELTPTQFDYLYEMIMFGYEMRRTRAERMGCPDV